MATIITDIHTHILPGLDDGPKNAEEASALLTYLKTSGVERAFCTTHYLSPHFHVSQSDLASGYANLSLIYHTLPSPALSAAAEVRLSPQLETDLRDGNVPTLGSTKYVLVEFPGDDVSTDNLRLVYELQVRGYIPIMAHPERNLGVQRNPSLIDELCDLGLTLQATADCFLKANTEMLTRDKIAWRFLEQGRISLIASDAHNITSRPPTLVQAYERIGTRLGQSTVDQLIENANAVWEGNPVEAVHVELVKRGLRGLFGQKR
ncbi:MAG: hypothetical protein A2201_05490 [Alicyclobacillus sp. RIFOXYA1_FULL_53_8]|nr:MAG: hypothetical protein A2201_05490 [Alicyclobacillus sp. RIFOXYA1_FULL_53_8]